MVTEMIRYNGITIDRKRLSISHNGKTCVFARLQFRLACALILAGPRGKEGLFNLVYHDWEDGGPLYGGDIIRIMTYYIRPKLSAIDIEIHSEPWGGNREQKRHWAEPRRVEVEHREAA